MKDLLRGRQISYIENANNMIVNLGLNRTPAGWALTLGKKIASIAESGSEM